VEQVIPPRKQVKLEKRENIGDLRAPPELVEAMEYRYRMSDLSDLLLKGTLPSQLACWCSQKSRVWNIRGLGSQPGTLSTAQVPLLVLRSVYSTTHDATYSAHPQQN
jgi:hypothetical protein